MKTLVFTGGHHTGALEVAKRLKSFGYNIVWFGHRHSMWGDKADSAEYTEVTAVGIRFYDLQAGKFYKTYNPLKLIRIPWGFVQAVWWLNQVKPDGIVSFGGYLAVPTVISGWLLGIPAITHEQTATAGWANQLIARFARRVAVTWPSSLYLYPREKVLLTGLPLRPGISSDREIKRQSDKLAIYITGGKQGAHAINMTVFAALSELVKRCGVIHQTGNSTLHNDYGKSLNFKYSNYQSFAYDSVRAIEALRQADVVVTRGGAHIVYELGVLGKKAVIIPIPWVSHNEQLVNAQILEQSDQAIILPENKLSAQTLIQAITQATKLKPKLLDLPKNGLERLIDLIQKEFN